jgi:hypothetical protein
VTLWLLPALLGGLLAGGVSVILGSRLRVLPPLLLLATAAGVSAALVAVIAVSPSSASLTDPGLGSVVLNRLSAGILVGGWAALVLQFAVARVPNRSGAVVGVGIAIGVGSCLALSVTGVVPLALILVLMCGGLWARWQHKVGPVLAVRSLGRQSAMILCALLAGAAVIPSERIGAAPAVLAGLVLVGGLGGVMGLLPLSSWVAAASRVGSGEAAVWRIWLVPVGMVALARVLVSGPTALEQVMQFLLVAMGLATAIFWSCAGFRADPATRYWRVLAADVGIICVGIGSGDAQGLAAGLVLVVVHWMAGAALSEPRGGRSHLVAWVGVSGVPPFGGFTGRILAVVGASFLGPLVVGLLLVAFGLQLAACGAGVREAVRRATKRGPRLSELAGLVAAIGTLVLGLVSGPVLSAAFGVRL